jgi:catechol 2,3-dioxygenase-like lactoylglutathione lyase family enzyme
MLDHIGVPVSDCARSKGFYLQVLRPLGYDLVMEVSSQETGGETACGFGAGSRPQFWIGGGHPITGHVHFAFEAKDRAAVDSFHAAALKAGGKDNGAPGLRPHYHAYYYGAFVLDPDGHNIEAVCHLAK